MISSLTTVTCVLCKGPCEAGSLQCAGCKSVQRDTKNSAPWTEREDTILRNTAGSATHRQMGELLGRTELAVRNRCSRLGLVFVRPWSDEEVTQLRAWYEARKGQPLYIKHLAEALKRSETSVSEKAAQLGLSDRNRPRSEEVSASQTERLRASIQAHGHPRGMLGKSHSPETRRRLTEVRTGRPLQLTDEERARRGEQARGLTMMYAEKVYTRALGGRRDDLGDRYFRSRWEANYARYLNLLLSLGQITAWDYEVATFEFPVRRGTTHYTPDFLVRFQDREEYHEVKGWMDATSATKIKRFRRFYPQLTLVIIDPPAYRRISQQFSALIPTWERYR